jgi:Trm5-related predicted tRNA methylase
MRQWIINSSRRLAYGEKQGLRFETPEPGSRSKSIVDLGRLDLIHRLERIDLNRQFRSTVKIVRSMVPSHCGD